MMKQAIAVQVSKNRKTGPVATTYAGQRACPASCPFMGKGCYAEKGHMGIHTRRLNSAPKISKRAMAQAEADAIDAIRPVAGLPMRLHVVGDCATPEAARIVSAAAERYTERGGGPAWTYTHAHARVPREAWGKVSVLASVHSPADGLAALSRGYAPAVVVDEFPSRSRGERWLSALSRGRAAAEVAKEHPSRSWTEDGVRWVACPEQVKGTQCVDCKLCMKADMLRDKGVGIAFRKH